MKNKIGNNGYTLIELLVVIAIMGVLMMVGSNIFVSILRSNSKTLIIDQLREQGNKALELMSTSIDNASGLAEPADSSQDGNCLSEIIVKNKTSDPNFTNVVGNNAYTRFRFVSEGANTNGYIGVDSASSVAALPATATPLTATTGAAAISLTTAAYPNANAACFIIAHGTSGNTIVRVQYSLKQSVNAPAGRQEYAGTVNFQSSFTIRNY